MNTTKISNTLFLVILIAMIGFSDCKKIQKFLNSNKNWFNIVNDGGLCVSSPDKAGNMITQQICEKTDNVLWRLVKEGDYSYLVSKNGFSMNNMGGIKVNGHIVYGSNFNKDNSEQWTIKDLGKNNKVQILNHMTRMCLSNEGHIQINSKHTIRNCNRYRSNQLFEIKNVKFE